MDAVEIINGSISALNQYREKERRPYHRRCTCELHYLKNVYATYSACFQHKNVITFTKKQPCCRSSILSLISSKRIETTTRSIYERSSLTRKNLGINKHIFRYKFLQYHILDLVSLKITIFFCCILLHTRNFSVIQIQ